MSLQTERLLVLCYLGSESVYLAVDVLRNVIGLEQLVCCVRAAVKSDDTVGGFLVTKLHKRDRLACHRSKEIIVHKIYAVVVKVRAEKSRCILDGMNSLALGIAAKTSVLPSALTVMAKSLGKLVYHRVGNTTRAAVDVVYGNDNEAALAGVKRVHNLGNLLAAKVLARLDQRDEVHNCGNALSLLTVSCSDDHKRRCFAFSVRVVGRIESSARRAVVCRAVVILLLTVGHVFYFSVAC